MTTEAKVLLYVVGGLDYLKTNGYVGGDGVNLAIPGVAVFDQLEAAGFRPTEEQVLDALACLTASGKFAASEEDTKAIATLIYRLDEVKLRDGEE